MGRSRPILIYSEIRVRNLPRALRFYRAVGLTPATKGRMSDGTRLVWLRDRRTRHLLELYYVPPRSPLYRPFQRPARPDPQLTFTVRDAGPLLAQLRRLGARVTEDFQEGPYRLTFVLDPDGNCLELVSWTAGAVRAHRDPPLLRWLMPKKREVARGN